jgi:NADPH:quinone reductase-like Zn-dependent oxidoreductase
MSKSHRAVVTVEARKPLEVRDVPTPIPKANEVLVHVEWTASTPLDLHQADGGLLVKHPQVLGDSSGGTVADVGPEVKQFAVGDKVFGFAWRTPQEKGHQEYLLAPENLLGKLPNGVKLQDAVTIPSPFVTAYQSSIHDLGLELPWPKPEAWAPKDADKAILIWGGSASVGTYAIQILHYFGYKDIIATASKKHHGYLKELGATSVVDYNDADVVQRVKNLAGGKVQFIMDCIGSINGTLKPIVQIADKGTIVAVMLPVILKDATQTEAPEYEMDVSKVLAWPEGVQAIGVRTHFYLQVSLPSSCFDFGG